MLKSLFSIYNDYSNNKKHKVFNICGIKFKFRKKYVVCKNNNVVDFWCDIFDCEKYWIEKFIDELSKTDFFQEYKKLIEKLFTRKLENKEKIKNLDIIDAGACSGDSALILSELTDRNVYAFEPVSSNYENMLKTIELNDVKNIIP